MLTDEIGASVTDNTARKWLGNSGSNPSYQLLPLVQRKAGGGIDGVH